MTNLNSMNGRSIFDASRLTTHSLGVCSAMRSPAGLSQLPRYGPLPARASLWPARSCGARTFRRIILPKSATALSSRLRLATHSVKAEL